MKSEGGSKQKKRMCEEGVWRWGVKLLAAVELLRPQSPPTAAAVRLEPLWQLPPPCCAPAWGLRNAGTRACCADQGRSTSTMRPLKLQLTGQLRGCVVCSSTITRGTVQQPMQLPMAAAAHAAAGALPLAMPMLPWLRRHRCHRLQPATRPMAQAAIWRCKLRRR